MEGSWKKSLYSALLNGYLRSIKKKIDVKDRYWRNSHRSLEDLWHFKWWAINCKVRGILLRETSTKVNKQVIKETKLGIVKTKGFSSWENKTAGVPHRPISLLLLTHFMPLVSFDTPSKHQKTRGFQMFSGVIERN